MSVKALASGYQRKEQAAAGKNVVRHNSASAFTLGQRNDNKKQNPLEEQPINKKIELYEEFSKPKPSNSKK